MRYDMVRVPDLGGWGEVYAVIDREQITLISRQYLPRYYDWKVLVN